MSADVTVGFFGKDASLGRTTKDLDKKLETFGKRVKQTLAIGAGIIAARKLTGWMADLIHLSEENAAASAKMNAVFNATGHAAGYSAAQGEKLADALAEVSNYSKIANQGAISILATFKQIKGDNFTDALLAIQDISTVMDNDLKGAAIQVGKALNDPVKGMAALAEVGVTFNAVQKRLITDFMASNNVAAAQRVILQELAGEFGGAAGAAADTFSGKVDNLTEGFRKMGEYVGSYFVKAIVSSMDFVIDAVATVVAAIATFSVSLETLPTSWSLVWTDIAGTLVGVTLDMYSRWTWLVDVMFTAWENTGGEMIRYIDYLGNNVLHMFEQLQAEIRAVFTGADVEQMWDPMFDGFKSKVKELPEYAGRELTQMEKDINERSAALKKKLEDMKEKSDGAFGAAFEHAQSAGRKMFGIGGDGNPSEGRKNLPKADLGTAFDPLLLKFDSILGKALSGDYTKGAFGALGSAQTKLNEFVDDVSNKDKPDKKEKQSSGGIIGLEELYSRIQGAAAGTPAERAAIDTAKATRDAVILQKKTAFVSNQMGRDLAKISNKLTKGSFLSLFSK